MIKIGCCLNMNASGDPKIGAEAIPVFANLGFDYVELPLAQVMELTEDKFNGLLSVIRTTGIPVDSCNNFFPARIRLTGNDVKPDVTMDYVKSAVDRAAAMGVKIIVLGSSGAKNIPQGFPYESARSQFIELLVKIDSLIKPFGITVVLEPLNKKESNFITTAAEGLEIVRETSLDNIKLLIDYYHLRMEDEDPAVINKAGRDLRHLHIASKENRLFPKPGDNENYADFFTRLKAANYDGRISVEGYSSDLNTDGAVTLKLLRSFF